MSRLFHTLVVVGAGLTAAGCGGKSGRIPGGSGASGGAAGGGATAGAGTGGSDPGTGGTSDAGSGGQAGSGTGGQAGSGAGGQASSGRGGQSGSAGQSGGGDGGIIGEAGSPGVPEPGPETTWDCSGQFGVCLPNQGAYIGDAVCPEDASRPASAEDCATGEVFTCFIAATTNTDTILVNCSCDPAPSDQCEPCVWPDGRTVSQGICSDNTRICPCALTGILIAK